jgi:hypothetical protein
MGARVGVSAHRAGPGPSARPERAQDRPATGLLCRRRRLPSGRNRVRVGPDHLDPPGPAARSPPGAKAAAAVPADGLIGCIWSLATHGHPPGCGHRDGPSHRGRSPSEAADPTFRKRPPLPRSALRASYAARRAGVAVTAGRAAPDGWQGRSASGLSSPDRNGPGRGRAAGTPAFLRAPGGPHRRRHPVVRSNRRSRRSLPAGRAACRSGSAGRRPRVRLGEHLLHADVVLPVVAEIVVVGQ